MPVEDPGDAVSEPELDNIPEPLDQPSMEQQPESGSYSFEEAEALPPRVDPMQHTLDLAWPGYIYAGKAKRAVITAAVRMTYLLRRG